MGERILIEEKLHTFIYWIYERHRIFLKKELGDPRPWTLDPILDEYRFTNPFRENDKTTVWFRENMRKPLSNQDSVLMATIIFRWFNLIETGETLLKHNLHVDWKPDLAREKIKKQSKYVTGGYIIKTPDGMDKVDGVIWCINNLWADRDNLQEELLVNTNTLRRAHLIFQRYPYLGHFMSYELVTDLRHTYYLHDAEDIMTWANAGPGAMRGLNRIYGRDLNYTSKNHDWNAEMQYLLGRVKESDFRNYLTQSDAYDNSKFSEIIYNKFATTDFKFEMRDIEHSLCEFDKYERVHNGEGKPRGRYR